ncbi:CYTH domain-containing protein [Nocardia bovistercoris]|uniref:CYTH domain-containing protein n=1 Tax=Nocardia bovistercoris TaxID=2785916 RepID=UPI002FCD6B0B
MEVTEKIAGILVDAGIVERSPASEQVVVNTLTEGGFAALRSLGLRDIFTVRSTRRTWDVRTNDGKLVAQLALDDSHYETGALPNNVDNREVRLEIELQQEGRVDELSRIAAFCRSSLDAEDVSDSKFEHGLAHYYDANLRDKLETKVAFEELGDYDAVVKRVERGDFVPGYRFARAGGTRRIADLYFDTPKQELFQAGCYLRLRQEGTRRQVVFRRLTEEARQGLVLQHEVIADENAADPARGWDSIMEWLAEIARISPISAPDSFDHAADTLAKVGLRPILEIAVVRTAWIVERIPSDKQPDSFGTPEHVAKLKHDQVTYAHPGDHANVSRDVEFEITGVEDDSAAPDTLRRPLYHTFLAQFVEACTHQSSDHRVEQRISAKYFRGMAILGIAKSTPTWLNDGRLALQTSLVRENPDRLPIHRTDIRPQVRLLTAVVALIAGWFAMASGSDAGIGSGGGRIVWGSVLQLAGLISVTFAVVSLFRISSQVMASRYRLAVATIAAAATVGIGLPWFGRHATADAVALLSIVLTWSALVRDGVAFQPHPEQK